MFLYWVNDMSKIQKYWNTVKYLKLVQIFSQVSKRFKSRSKPEKIQAPQCRELSLCIPSLDLNESYIARFSPELILQGKVTLLHCPYEISFSMEMKKSMSPLCWFNLLYFEYAVSLAAVYSKSGEKAYLEAFKKIFNDYLRADLPYVPYVISLQIPNLLIALELFGDSLDREFVNTVNNEIYRQYRYLQRNCETHLLGNHYFENLKALIIASFYFQDDKRCSRYAQKLEKQANEQIQPDGTHFELSPMYHKIILEDLLRLNRLKGCQFLDWVPAAISKMANAMYVMGHGLSRTPLFNDAGDNVSKAYESLIKAVSVETGIDLYPEGNSLPDAGYYRLDRDGIIVIADCGKIGPDYIPGHGQCDCLSFELFYNGEPLIVNSGTYQYQGDKRKHFRSTAAHNTVVMDNSEQSQCWGEHRVAKRIGDLSACCDGKNFKGSYTSAYHKKHSRSITLESGEVLILDSTENAREARSYIRIPDSFSVSDELCVTDRQGEQVCSIEPINCCGKKCQDDEMTMYAPEFGKLERCTCIEFSWNGDKNSHGYRINFI